MDVEQLEKSIRDDVASTSTLDELENVRIKYLGRKGEITALLRAIKDASAEERPRLGSESNRLKLLFEALLQGKKSEFGGDRTSNLYVPPIDATLPSQDGVMGHRHVITQTLREMKEILYGARARWDCRVPRLPYRRGVGRMASHHA